MNLKKIFILFLIVSIAFGCKKAYDIPPAGVPMTFFNVINSTQNTFNYYLNGTRQNTASSIYPSGYTGYLSVASRTQTYQFRPNGSVNALFDKQLALTDSTYQTLYVTGNTADKAYLFSDTLITSTTGSNVRFAHTLDGAGALSVSVNDTLVFVNRSYKTVSAFQTLASGTKTLKVYAGNSTMPSATQKITFSIGNVYTLYVSALPNGAGQPALTIGYFVNK